MLGYWVKLLNEFHLFLLSFKNVVTRKSKIINVVHICGLYEILLERHWRKDPTLKMAPAWQALLPQSMGTCAVSRR